MNDRPTRVAILIPDPSTRELILGYLTPKGCPTNIHEDGKSLFTAIEDHGHIYSLVFIDVAVAEVADYELLEQLRTHSQLKTCPLIVISNPDKFKEVSRCLELGATDFLLCPFDALMLKTRIEPLLGHDFRKYMDELAALYIHEFKVPLSSMKGYAELLLEERVGPINGKQREFLNVIVNKANRQQEMFDDFRDIIWIDTGRLRLVKQTTSIIEVLEAMKKELKVSPNDKKQSLEINIPGNLPSVCIDELRLVQILLYILSNALQYTPENGRIVVSAIQAANDLHFVQISISDNGIGISQSDQLKIFQRWFRGNSSIVYETQGHGVHLHTAKAIIEQMGGKIWFESELNKGSTFHIAVPVATPECNKTV